MSQILRPEEIDFETHLKKEDIMEITKLFLGEKINDYEIDEDSVLYYTFSDTAKEAVWCIDIIMLKIKISFPDAYDTLVISDKEARVLYKRNDHGVLCERYDRNGKVFFNLYHGVGDD
ncbi:MAG: hypothetical protein HFH41_13265 [Lachnospiraceae bacterium]|nr:hypothetical protein [Lachnospiraceae bacterium]